MSTAPDPPARPWVGRFDPPTALFVLWALFIAYGTLLPFRFEPDVEEAARKLWSAADPLGRPLLRADVVSNILLFVPFGVTAAWRQGSRRVGYGAAVAASAAGGFALSGLVEGAQLFLPTRTTSLIDLATNTAGAALGALAGWPLVRRVWPAWSPSLDRLVAQRPVGACALACALGLVAAGLSPFDVSIDVGDLKAAVKKARPVPFGPPLRGEPPPAEPWSWALEGLVWSLAGGLAALALRESSPGTSYPVAKAAAACAALALSVEAAQLVIPARSVDATTAAVALAGSAAGAAVVSSSPGKAPRRWIGPALAVWASAAVLAAWTPPHLAPGGWRTPGLQQLVPFLSYYKKTDIYALSDLLIQVLAFAPLGALLAARDGRGSPWRPAVIGLCLGAVLEAGQLALADRTAEVTDALSSGLGAGLGAWAWGWAASVRNRSRLALRQQGTDSGGRPGSGIRGRGSSV